MKTNVFYPITFARLALMMLISGGCENTPSNSTVSGVEEAEIAETTLPEGIEEVGSIPAAPAPIQDVPIITKVTGTIWDWDKAPKYRYYNRIT